MALAAGMARTAIRGTDSEVGGTGVFVLLRNKHREACRISWRDDGPCYCFCESRSLRVTLNRKLRRLV